MTFSKSLGKTLTVSTTNSYVTGTKFTFTQKTSLGISIPGTGNVGEETTWSFETSFSYTHTDTSSRTNTEQITIQRTQNIPVPAKSRVEAALFYAVGTLPPTEYQTTAERWYDRALTGTVPDGGLYKRVEPVRITVEGGLAATGSVDIKQYPLLS